MLWLVFALLSAIFSGTKSLVHRFVLKTEYPLAYAFFENLLTGLVFIPILIVDWVLPIDAVAWVVLAVGAILWTAVSVVAAYSYKFTEVSLREPIHQTRLIWVLLLSVLLLGEIMTGAKVVATLLIFIGMILLVHKHGLKFGRLSDRGVQLTLLSAFLGAVVTIVDKIAMAYWSAGLYGMFVYLIPAAILVFFIRKDAAKVRKLVVRRGKYLILVAVLGLSYYFYLRALALADASVVFPIVRLGTMISVVGGIAFLRERKEILLRLVAVALTVIGAYLLF